MAAAAIGGQHDADKTASSAWEPTSDTRFTTMSIASRGHATVTAGELAGTGATGAARRAPILRAVNQTADIPGATARPRMGRYQQNRPDLVGTHDIDGARPRSTTSRLTNKPTLINKTDDIDGARASRRTFRTTRHVNPLEPNYALPEVKDTPPTPPRFVRDAFAVDDIVGAKPPPPAAERGGRGHHSPMDVTDIDGAVAKVVPESMKPPPRDVLTAKTVDKPAVARHFRTKRHTDPLCPRHSIYGAVVEDDPLSKPRSYVKGRARDMMSLGTRDIEGASPGWKPPHSGATALPEGKRRQYRDTTSVADVPGAQTGTLKRGLRTQRITDPNDRVYKPLDGRPPLPRRSDPQDVDTLDMGGTSTLPGGGGTLGRYGNGGGVGGSIYERSRPGAVGSAHAARAVGAEARAVAAEAEAADLRSKVGALERRLAARAEAWRTTGRFSTRPSATVSATGSAVSSRGSSAGGGVRSMGVTANAGDVTAHEVAGRPPSTGSTGAFDGTHGEESKTTDVMASPQQHPDVSGVSVSVKPQQQQQQQQEEAVSAAIDSARAAANADSAHGSARVRSRHGTTESGFAGATSASLSKYSGMTGPADNGLPSRPGSDGTSLLGASTRQSSARRGGGGAGGGDGGGGSARRGSGRVPSLPLSGAGRHAISGGSSARRSGREVAMEAQAVASVRDLPDY